MKEYGALFGTSTGSEGNVRSDAKVTLKLSRIRFDAESKTYRLRTAIQTEDQCQYYSDDLIANANANAYRIVKRDSLLQELVDHANVFYEGKEVRWMEYIPYRQCTTECIPRSDRSGCGGKGNDSTMAISGAENGVISSFPFKTHLEPEQG